MSMDIAVVQCFVEFLRVGRMLGGGGGEVVFSAEIFLGAEEKVGGFLVFQNGIDGGNGRDADGSRREAGIEVGVVGAVGGEHGAPDATDGEVAKGEFDGGVGLKGHTGSEAVEVDGGDVGFLVVGIGLFVDDGGDGEDLLAGEAEGLELVLTFGPEVVGLTFHAVEEGYWRCGPVDFVGVWEEEADDGLRGFAIAGTGLLGLHEGKEAVGIESETGAEELAELGRGAVFVDGQTDGVLVAGVEFLDNCHDGHVGLEEIAARFDSLVESTDAGKRMEGGVVGYTAMAVEAVDKGLIV